MTTPLLAEEIAVVQEQRFTLPGDYSWEQFEAIAVLMSDAPGLRLTYLDGTIEFMTVGEDHEEIKKVIAILLEAYLFEMGIEFIPVGSATRQAKEKRVSFEPDESYYLGVKKENPDLAIEVVMTSGSPKKLEKYKRFNIPEVWFWQNKQIAIYGLRENGYEQIARSEFLPELNLNLFESCIQSNSILAARTEFLKEVRLDNR